MCIGVTTIIVRLIEINDQKIFAPKKYLYLLIKITQRVQHFRARSHFSLILIRIDETLERENNYKGCSTSSHSPRR